MRLDVLQAAPCDALQKVGHGEEGTRTQPARHVVAHDVIHQALLRDGEDVVLQVLQVVDVELRVELGLPGEGGVLDVEDEVAEAEGIVHDVAQIDVHLLGVLVDEVVALAVGLLEVLALGAVHDEGHVGVFGTNGVEQTEAGACVLLVIGGIGALDGMEGETAVGDDAEGVVLESAVEVPCLVEVTGQHNLRTTTHTQRLERGIEGFGGKLEALLEHELIEAGEDGRIETDVVLDHQYHTHTRLDIVLEVHLVLEQLDDGEQQFGVAQPAEDVFEEREVDVLHACRDAMAEGGEHDDGDVVVLELDGLGNLEDILLLCIGCARRHDDDEVDVVGFDTLFGLVERRSLDEAGWEAKSQAGIFCKNLFIDSAIVFEHEGIVGIGHNQHVADAALHEFGEVGVLKLEHRDI